MITAGLPANARYLLCVFQLSFERQYALRLQTLTHTLRIGADYMICVYAQ